MAFPPKAMRHRLGLIVYVIAICCLRGAHTISYYCNNRFLEADNPDINVRCSYISKTPATWDEAHNFCHERRGWVANWPSFTNESEHGLGRELLIYNDVSSIWSGIHIRDYKLLNPSFPAPKELHVNINNERSFWNMTANSYGCVIDELNCDTDQPTPTPFPDEIPQRRRRSVPADCIEKGKYLQRFVSCDEKHFFGCYFAGINLNDEGVSQVVAATSDERVRVYDEYFLSVQMFVTQKKTSYYNSDSACAQRLLNGTTFKESNRNPLRSLSLLGQALKAWSDGKTNTYYQRQLHWFHTEPGNECNAAILDVSYSQENQGYSVMSWPCDAMLPSVCQIDKPNKADWTVKLQVSLLENVRLIDDEIRGRTNDLQIYANGATMRMECQVSNMDTPYSGTFYRSGTPMAFFDSKNDEPPYVYRLSLDQGDDINLFQSVYCEVHSRNNNNILTSQTIFTRPTDLRIYSVHFDLYDDVPEDFIWAFYGASLRVPNLDNVELPLPNFPPVGRLNEMVKGWRFKQMVFMPKGGLNTHSTLVIYVYTDLFRVNGEDTLSRRKRQTPASDDREAERLRFDEIKSALNQTFINWEPRAWYPLDTSSLRVLSIDWCWSKEVNDTATNRQYSLPTTKRGVVYKSPQTCARDDNNPLVTVECRGDRFVGYDWGPVVVNDLCDYTATDEEDESKITKSLQLISQENITSENVNTYLNESKLLTSLLTDETVITKDILYVADILQKSLDIEDLSPSAAQDILDIVDAVSNLKSTTLTEAQEIGLATNRILKSVDKLGGQMSVIPKAKFERVISGQYALEVWDLTSMDDDSFIVGLKILSSGGSVTITNNELISLFSPESLEYNEAEAAILLPKELIKSILANEGPNADLKLAMNVYRDTTLYTDDTVAYGTNSTLNSKVIAAQMLLNGEPIRNLGRYKVTTVFLPKKSVKEEDRPTYSVCAYWDFDARDGAGAWGTNGCQYERTEAGRDVCVCDHLTNFAVLLNFGSQEDVSDEHQLALSIITIVGLSLSILGLSISILSFLCIKKLRKGYTQQTLFNLALALLLSWVVFLAGVDRTESHGGCIAVAAILHYLILASFMWMLMEGILQYLLMVRVMKTYYPKYMWKTGITAWGLPIIPVIIVFAIDPELYKGGEEYCWMSTDAFLYAFAIPVGLIIVTNLIIFIIVVVTLCRSKDMSQFSSQSKNQTIVSIRGSFLFFFLLGMSWIFGFLTLEDARTAFQYIFCITATLQGFVIFAMMTARNKTIRQFWINFCCCRNNDKGSGYRTSNDRAGNGSSSQEAHRIPRLNKDKGGAYHGSSSTQVTSNATSLSDGDQSVHGNSFDDIPCDYE